LVHLEDSNFASLIRLTYLDLSHNDALSFENRGRMFLGLEQSLQHLRLKNTSLTSVSNEYFMFYINFIYFYNNNIICNFIFQIPELPLPSLLSLDLSVNQISSVSPDRASNLSSLRNLDLSHNELIGFPSIIMNLPELNNLNLSNNHIYDLNNSTLNMGVQKLISLDLSYMPLVSFEVRKTILKNCYIYFHYYVLFFRLVL